MKSFAPKSTAPMTALSFAACGLQALQPPSWQTRQGHEKTEAGTGKACPGAFTEKIEKLTAGPCVLHLPAGVANLCGSCVTRSNTTCRSVVW